MRFIVYLLTLFMVGTAVAQNPTILQGNYITNVFGQSNFVLNPNAQTNIANVTVSSATVTRSTTTPLVATSEFNITTSTATGYADWATRTFDAGMKNQNCEARFTYRGFSVGSTSVQIRQGSNTVAQLTLTASTDPRIASINFPCGDLSSATTLRVQQATAALTGTNEIGGIYVGLATNQANVAQAEFVGGYTVDSVSTNPNTLSATLSNLSSGNFSATLNGKATSYDAASASVTFSYLPAGTYQVSHNAFIYPNTAGGQCRFALKEDTSGDIRGQQYVTYSTVNASGVAPAVARFDFSVGASRTFRIVALLAGSGNCNLELINGSIKTQFNVYRFPTSSELVVTPERQNWYIDAKHAGANPSLGNTSKTSRTEITDSGLTLTPSSGSQPVATLCASGNNPPAPSTSATTCSAGNESLGLTFNIPSVGTYEVCAQFGQYQDLASGGTADVTVSIEETSTTSSTPLTTNPSNTRYSFITATANITTAPFNQCNVFKFDSVGQKAVRLMYFQNVGGTINNNFILGDEVRARAISWAVRPVTNQSNSALYVQGPVKAAATGAAISSGYLGESIYSSLVNGSTTTSGNWVFTSSGVTLQPGVWLVSGYCSVMITTNLAMGCGISTNNSTTGLIYDQLWNQIAWISSVVPHTMYAPGKIVRITTPTLLYFGNVQLGVAAVTYGNRLEAVRLN